ncbi:hypothetical protein PAAG_06859 [Paracoccidioides lutzii Pb01]|uniref:Uncharacterized protein n=1 Tax=Paracoccidioides lutzii (strain ATCC MYA-826 / Pb01) TaxID=502779 RepID=C1H7W8_PARBA|nr:hypothetical protein PAAG_06859 [Paracoccidioides lutzii Pb01]EEH36441.2 hypothetical protein PAAG_06859 [Paracoccidioides lutzii Pb01]
MCYRIIERYSVCRCLYYRHAVDPCQSYGQRDHVVQEKTILVGYACAAHLASRGTSAAKWPDSGYSSGKGASP